MSTVVKDLGAVSAYAYAVEKGYTGTEAEFAELMASYADVGQTAVDAKDAAVAAKTAAQTAATTATNKASEATTAAQTATTKAGEAQTSAQTASTKASEASQSASTASAKATEATTAAATATSAATTATTAKDDAVSAKTAAQTAQTGAETAAASVSASAEQIATNTEDISQLKSEKADVTDLLKAFPTDSAQGAIASFTDGAELPLKSLTVDIEPIQDLHGYDNPWPAGGWKNKANYPALISAGCVEQTDGSLYIDTPSLLSNIVVFQNDGTTGQFSITFIYKNDTTTRGAYPNIIYTDGTTENLPVNSGSTAYRTVTKVTLEGKTVNKITITYGSNVKTWFYIQIEKGDTPTAWSPYSNICPISGWSEVNVHRTGKNLFDVHFDNTISGNSHLYMPKLKPNTQYTCSSNLPLSTVASVYFGGGSTNINGVFDGTPKTMTTDANGNINIYIRHIASDGGINMYQALLDGTYWVQVEDGATATPYEPYSGQNINIQLGQTVYGGKLGVTKGELTVDNICINPSDFTILRVSGNGTTTTALIKGITQGKEFTAISNRFSQNISPNTAGRMVQTVSEIYVVLLTADLTSDTNEGVRAWFSNNPTQICYELATPLTIQLNPHEVRSLLGDNIIWADSGDSEVTYRADPTLYIGRLAEPDADMVADANITSGQYFMVGNTLYKATANIASGGAITPNVNCTRKSLSEALNELNA